MHIPTLSARQRNRSASRDDASGYALRRVAAREDWTAVRALRFAALSSHGDIPRAAGPTYGDAHDTAPATSTFLLTRNGGALASTRTSFTCAARPARLPAMDPFAADIERALGTTAVVEASLTVVDPEAADPATAILHLFRAHMLACAALDAQWLVAAVRDSQIGFYRRVFDMEILSGVECVPGMAVPRVLMGMRYREQAPALFARIPILAPTAADAGLFAESPG